MLEAHSARHHARSKIAALQSGLKTAERDRSNFGHYDDCGAFYQEEYAAAKAKHDAGIERKVSAEKHFKKMKLTFIENHPDFADELQRRLDAQAKEHTAMIDTGEQNHG